MSISLPYQLFTLSNGLRVIVHEDHRTPVACVNVWYHVGSLDEVRGRTGFAHLFEHLMFEGSEHVPEGSFDELLEEVGGVNNGSTSTDRTNYWELVPSHAVDLALWLEADRMGGLLPAITQAQLDAQRDVVRNERRQSYENRPYGLASETLLAAMYPPEHPYSWPIIGSMADLGAATLDDVRSFFARFYTPSNATIAIAGDVDAARVRATVEHYFGDIPVGTGSPRRPTRMDFRERTDSPEHLVLEDDVSLPRLYLGWHSPAAFEDGDAALDVASQILGHGRASRLHRSLVYELQLAQSVTAYQSSALLGSTFHVTVTARPGVPLAQLEDAVRGEIAAMASTVHEEELARARNGIETGFVDSLQSVGGFGGRADQLNMYMFHLGEPDSAATDLQRYSSLTAERVAAAVHEHLMTPGVALSVVPRGAPTLAAR